MARPKFTKISPYLKVCVLDDYTESTLRKVVGFPYESLGAIPGVSYNAGEIKVSEYKIGYNVYGNRVRYIITPKENLNNVRTYFNDVPQIVVFAVNLAGSAQMVESIMSAAHLKGLPEGIIPMYVGIQGKIVDVAVEKAFSEVTIPNGAIRIVVNEQTLKETVLHQYEEQANYVALRAKLQILQNLVDYIEGMEFEYGDANVSKQGVTVNMEYSDRKKRLPQSVADIYKVLMKGTMRTENTFRSEITDTEVDEILLAVKELAIKAVQKPILGTKPSTTAFYEHIDRDIMGELPDPFPSVPVHGVGEFSEVPRNLNTLQDILEYIENTEFEVGGMGMFKGGVNVVMSDGQSRRLPHRVADIYRTLTASNTEIRSLDTPLDVHEKAVSYDAKAIVALKDVQDIAKKALKKPRLGRKPSTTEFYERILEAKWDEVKPAPISAPSSQTGGVN